MDHINKVLSTISMSTKFSKPIQVACGITKKALKCYYSYTDMSATYHITMSKFCVFCVLPPANVLTFVLLVLHPSHKVHYFKMCWPEAWYTTAKELLIKKYRGSYKGCYVNKDSKDNKQDNKQDNNNLSDICSTNRSTRRSSGRSSWASFYDKKDGAPSPSNNNNDGTDEESSELNVNPFLPILTCALPNCIIYRIRTCLMPLPQLLTSMCLSWG